MRTRPRAPRPPTQVREGAAPEARLDALVRCAQGGDPQAFRTVAEHFTPRLTRYVERFCRDPGTADDVVQETLLSAWHRLDTIRGADHLQPWLYRVARFKAISWLRRRGPRGRPMASLHDQAAEFLPARPASRPPGAQPPDDVIGALRAAVARLPPIYRGVVRLHYLHGHTTNEVAGLLGLAQSTVKMRLHRARHTLARFVTQEVRRRSAAGRRDLATWVPAPPTAPASDRP